MQNIAKMLGTGISILTLLLSLISSWTYFYSEQKINTMQIAGQQRMLDKHEEELKGMFNQQSRIIETISYNSKDIKSVQDNIDKLIDIQQKNQVYLTKIATRVGVDK